MRNSLVFILLWYGLFKTYRCVPDNEKCVEGGTGNTCVKCKDEECLSCSDDKIKSCTKCNIGFQLLDRQCGHQCDTIEKCKICSVDSLNCLECENQCEIKEGKCSCVAKYVIITVCILIGIIVVGIVIFCLTKPSLFAKNKVGINLNAFKVNIANNPVLTQNQNISTRAQETDKINLTTDISRISEETTLNEMFKLNIIEIAELKDKQTCCYCLTETATFIMSCGCFICSEHVISLEHSSKGIRQCTKCKNEIKEIKPITCGICFQNSQELSKFQCLCSLVVCKDCFFRLKRSIKNCPACRAII